MLKLDHELMGWLPVGLKHFMRIQFFRLGLYKSP